MSEKKLFQILDSAGRLSQLMKDKGVKIDKLINDSNLFPDDNDLVSREEFELLKAEFGDCKDHHSIHEKLSELRKEFEEQKADDVTFYDGDPQPVNPCG